MNPGYLPHTSVRQAIESVTLGALSTKTATVTNKTEWIDPFCLYVLFCSKLVHVMILQRTVSFKCRPYSRVHVRKIIKKQKGKFLRDLHIQPKEVYSRLFVQSSSQLPYCFLTRALVIVAFFVFKAPLYPVHTNLKNFETAYIYVHILSLHRFMWTGL